MPAAKMEENLGGIAIAGATAGLAKTIISHPLDTVKVHIQTARPVPRSLHGLFRGVSVPVFRNGIEHSMHFFLRSVVANGMVAAGLPGSDNPWLIGFLAGFPQSLVNCPMDYARLSLQIGNKLKVRSVYRGLPWVVLKESCSGMAFFGVYEGLKRCGAVPGVAGSAAALTAMISTYPMDTLKNRVQSGSTLKQAAGMKSFGSGLPWAVGKCLAANFVALTVYEAALAQHRTYTAQKQGAAAARAAAGGAGAGQPAAGGTGGLRPSLERKANRASKQQQQQQQLSDEVPHSRGTQEMATVASASSGPSL